MTLAQPNGHCPRQRCELAAVCEVRWRGFDRPQPGHALQKSKRKNADSAASSSDPAARNGEAKKAKASSSKHAAGSTATSTGSRQEASAPTSKQQSSAEQSKGAGSIQDDPSASKVYKSLFNTCDKAKQQASGPWVTYNPQYY